MASRGFGESMTPRELAAELAALSKAEKAEVVERLAQEISDTWAGIEKTPGVAGGAACSEPRTSSTRGRTRRYTGRRSRRRSGRTRPRKALRRLGHDVLTAFEAGQANERIPDDAVVESSGRQRRSMWRCVVSPRCRAA